jgi:hypothetical protein
MMILLKSLVAYM